MDSKVKTDSTTCKRCGRRLKSPESIEIGMGKTCYKKFMKEDNHKRLWKGVNNGQDK